MSDYNFDLIKSIVKKGLQIPFRERWQFRITIDGEPPDFDFYVKDVSYGTIIEFGTDEEEGGSGAIFTYPTVSKPVNVSMNVKDDENLTIYQWFTAWGQKVANSDGTMNLPKDYLKKLTRYSVGFDGVEKQIDQWEVFLSQVGEMSEAREAGEEIFSFPVTMIQFSNMGLSISSFSTDIPGAF